jgi:hypothetical protein
MIKTLEDAGYEVRTAPTAAAAQHSAAHISSASPGQHDVLTSLILSQLLQYWCGTHM